MPRPDNLKVAVVQGGDPRGPEALGDSGDRGVGTTEAQVGVGDDESTDALPVLSEEVLHEKSAVVDRGVQGGLGARAELAIDQVRGLSDDHGSRDERSRVRLEEVSTGRVVGITAVGRSHQRAGVDDEHSVAPEALSEQLVGVDGVLATGRCPDAGERQVTASTRRGDGLGEPGDKGLGDHLVDADPAALGLGGSASDQILGECDRKRHAAESRWLLEVASFFSSSLVGRQVTIDNHDPVEQRSYRPTLKACPANCGTSASLQVGGSQQKRCQWPYQGVRR